MAEKERLRLRQTFAELLSPSAVSQTARGTLTDHDEPVVGGGVKGGPGAYAGSSGTIQMILRGIYTRT